VKRKMQKRKLRYTHMFELRQQKTSRDIWTTFPPSKYPSQQRHRYFVSQHIQKRGTKGTLVHECRTSDERLCVLRCVYEYRNPKAV